MKYICLRTGKTPKCRHRSNLNDVLLDTDGTPIGKIAIVECVTDIDCIHKSSYAEYKANLDKIAGV